MLNINLNQLLASFMVTGEDATKFLQGQLTNDISLLDNHPFQHSAYLNNKGRILASLWIKKTDDNKYYVIISKDLIDKVVSKLKMYVLRSKVVIEKSQLDIVFNDVSEAANENVITNFAISTGYFITLMNPIEKPAANLDNEVYNLAPFKHYLINNGIPIIYAETTEQLIPQHVNFDEIGGLNFTKGCYLGQEIVARMHYLGKSKRKMYHFSTPGEVKVGQAVVSPKLNNQEVGIVVDIVKQEINYIGLVSLQNDCIDSAFLDKQNQHQLIITEIKYYLETAK